MYTNFVVHEHNAKKAGLHHDLRIEIDGVLQSFVVPKLVSETERRLAIKVDDHALSYFNFEGTIPDDSYGAGTVKIYDTGECKVVLNKGSYFIEFFGLKLTGTWDLRLFDERNRKYLLIKQSKLAYETYKKKMREARRSLLYV